jgi:cytochrome oxidase Cu insertion factor (SCO1/SenC/PrrC family)
MKNLRFWFIMALVVIAGGVGVFWFARNATSANQPYEGTELDGIAPDFRLLDQNGTFVSLSDFRGKVVVLTFMDSQCKDTCPITSAHFRQAYGQLDQNEAKQVVFLGVNVTVEANTVPDVLETTRAWHMDEIPSWHFLTGSREELEPVWKAYDVTVEPVPDGSAIMHTPGVFIIDPSGQKRWYVSTVFPGAGNTELTLPLSELLVNHIREILRDG